MGWAETYQENTLLCLYNGRHRVLFQDMFAPGMKLSTRVFLYFRLCVATVLLFVCLCCFFALVLSTAAKDPTVSLSLLVWGGCVFISLYNWLNILDLIKQKFSFHLSITVFLLVSIPAILHGHVYVLFLIPNELLEFPVYTFVGIAYALFYSSSAYYLNTPFATLCTLFPAVMAASVLYATALSDSFKAVKQHAKTLSFFITVAYLFVYLIYLEINSLYLHSCFNSFNTVVKESMDAMFFFAGKIFQSPPASVPSIPGVLA
ncbi:hypothetical protein NECID01_0234 [Nematocida sp. AWRm77]|nr:hypothetical protein NECID01_0234 [Nematocida sp. AWRm77]